MEIRLLLCLLGILFAHASFSQEKFNKKKINIDYLGQKPPSETPEIFAYGIISSDFYEHSSPAFSPDGNTILWTVISDRYKPSFLLEIKKENGVWTKPAKPAFADTTADDMYPSFSRDGKKLYFNSRRKVPVGFPEDKGIRIWEVEKTKHGWGKPIPFDTTVSKGEDYAHSVAENGSIYFSFRRENGKVFDMAFSKKKGKKYAKPEILPLPINSLEYDDGIFIAPDESYLIFESGRKGGIENSIDLYISFKKSDGTWETPINMGDKINSKFAERFASVSPDGKYLFFGSNRREDPKSFGMDIYWVNAKIIDDLRKK